MFIIYTKHLNNKQYTLSIRVSMPIRGPINGPFYVDFDGLMAILRSERRSNVAIKRMLVSHSFVDLFHIINTDKSFSQSLFDTLDESERDFMRYLLKKCKIESREFEAAYNKILSAYVSKLHMLQKAKSIGDDNPNIKKEMMSLLDKLYEKGMFSSAYYAHLKRSFIA
jgi:hypothetical protein